MAAPSLAVMPVSMPVAVPLLVPTVIAVGAGLPSHPVGPGPVAIVAVATLPVAPPAGEGLAIPVDDPASVAPRAAGVERHSGDRQVVGVRELRHEVRHLRVHGVGVHARVEGVSVHAGVEVRVHAGVVRIRVHPGVEVRVHPWGEIRVRVHARVEGICVHPGWEVGIGVHAWVVATLVVSALVVAALEASLIPTHLICDTGKKSPVLKDTLLCYYEYHPLASSLSLYSLSFRNMSLVKGLSYTDPLWRILSVSVFPATISES